MLQLAIGANIDSVVRDTEIDCHNNTNTSANPSLSHPSTSSSSSCVPAQYLLSAVVRQCAITTQRGIIVSLLITFFSSQGTCTEILNVVVCCLTTLLRVVHKEVVQFFLNEIKSLLSTCASPTNSPDLIRQFQRAYNIHISLYSAYDIETHMELLLCRLPMAALFARHDPDISATLHAMLQTLSDSIQTYSSNQVHTQSGSTDSNKRLHSDMNNTMNASSSSLSSQSQLQLQTKNKANITVSHAISMLLSISSDELCQSRYIRSNAQRSSVSECALLMQTKHTVSAIKLFQLISTTMKYMNAYCTSVAVIDLCRLHRLSTTVFRLCQPLRALFCPQMPLSAADSLLEYARVMMVQVMSLWREINELYQAEGRNQIDRVDQANNDMVATGISTKQVRYNSQYEQLMRTCESCLECACELLLTTAGVEKLWSMSASNNNDNGATDYEGRYRRVSEVVSNLCTLTLGTYSLASHDRTETIQHNTVQTWSFCGRVSTQCGSAILDLLSVLPDTWKVRLKQVLPIEV